MENFTYQHCILHIERNIDTICNTQLPYYLARPLVSWKCIARPLSSYKRAEHCQLFQTYSPKFEIFPAKRGRSWKDTGIGPMGGHRGRTNRRPISAANHGSKYMIGPGSV